MNRGFVEVEFFDVVLVLFGVFVLVLPIARDVVVDVRGVFFDTFSSGVPRGVEDDSRCIGPSE